MDTDKLPGADVQKHLSDMLQRPHSLAALEHFHTGCAKKQSPTFDHNP
jgi:hypothetical protein